MSFSDFIKEFEKLEVCNLGPEVMDEIQAMTGVTKVRALLHYFSALCDNPKT